MGETVDRYTVEGLCGQGAMGEVYAALDTRLRRRVALKVLRANDARPDAVARIFREARAAAALSHPHTVAIHDLLETESGVTIVMELVSGKPLREYIGDATIPMVRRVEWLVAVARALAAAHRAGIVHRDIKPSNVMVSDEGMVKVLDFGLARPSDPSSFRTQRGYVLGTPKYMAPEQLEGREADARSDQYAFGLVAFELLSGHHPGLPGEERKTLDGVAVSLAAVVLRTLEVAPEKRFETMDDVAVVLEDRTRALDQAPSTTPDPAFETTPAVVAIPPMQPDTERAPASFAERHVVVARAQPILRTLFSKEAPSEIVRLNRRPPIAPTVLETTMKSNEKGQDTRAAVIQELARRQVHAAPPSALAALNARAPHVPTNTEPVGVPVSVKPEVPKSSLTPAVVLVAVVVLAGLAAAVFMKTKARPAMPAANAAEPPAVVSAMPPATVVTPPEAPTPTPAPVLSAPRPKAHGQRPRPGTSAASPAVAPPDKDGLAAPFDKGTTPGY